MKKTSRSRKFTTKQSARLGAYFAAGVGASMAATSTSEAAIVNINIGPSGFNIGGPNAGVSAGSYSRVSNFPSAGSGSLLLFNAYSGGRYWGLYGSYGLLFAGPGSEQATIFALNGLIDSGSLFSPASAFFRADGNGTPTVPALGPGSYLGFRTDGGNYGWLEVLWNGTDEWEILSGAYEDQAGVAILAGASAGPAAVPEPGTWAAAALLAGGAAFARWRKRRNEAQKEAA